LVHADEGRPLTPKAFARVASTPSWPAFWSWLRRARHTRPATSPRGRPTFTSLVPEHGGGALLDLLRRDVFLVRADGPFVAEGVGDGAGAVAVELVLQRLEHFRAERHGPIEHRVAVLEIERQPDRRAADGLRAARVHLRMFISEHNVRIADLDFRVADFPTGRADAHQFGGAERLFVEFNRAPSAIDDQVRRRGVIPFGDLFRFLCHSAHCLRKNVEGVHAENQAVRKHTESSCDCAYSRSATPIVNRSPGWSTCRGWIS